MNSQKLFLACFYVFLGVVLYSCNVSKRIDKQFNKGHYDLVIRTIESKSKKSAEDNFLLAESYRKSNRIKESEPYYKAAIDQEYEDESVYFHYARALEANESYQQAETVLQDYISKGEDDHVLKLAQGELDGLLELDKLKKEGSYFKVKNLQDINTPAIEYSPIYNNGFLYFTSNREGGKIYLNNGQHFTNIYKVKTKGAKVQMESLKALDPIFNDPNTNEGSIAISADGNSVIFAKGNHGKPTGTDNVNLYTTRYRNGKWTNPRILGICDPRAWDSSPALSADGRTLYFASNRKGGYGGTDIYVAKRDPRGRWVDVRNLGEAINTFGNEMYPFVSDDGKLYFSSDGHPGFGQLDMFEATRSKGIITVKNMGEPINSSADDFGIHEFNLTRGFFTSNREGGKGDDDIYTYVNEDPDLKIVKYVLQGKTVTMDDGGKEVILPNSKVTLTGLDDEILDEAFTGSKGQFKFQVFPEEDYDLIGEKANFFTTRKGFTTIGKSVDKSTLTEFETTITFEIKIVLEPIVLDQPIVLDNIYYDLDKWAIRDDAAKELDKLVTTLQDNPDISIELSSHTDSRQTDEYNEVLSDKRAKSAVNYLISKGINSGRLIAKGYGESQLIVKNAQTEEEHQVNRRTEFKVIKYNKKIVRDEEVDETDRFFDDEDDGESDQ
ncbi:MAG: OmpA family protein [Bacteroidota bacterium]